MIMPKNLIIYLIVLYIFYFGAIFFNLVGFHFIDLMIPLVSCIIVSVGLYFLRNR